MREVKRKSVDSCRGENVNLALIACDALAKTKIVMPPWLLLPILFKALLMPYISTYPENTLENDKQDAILIHLPSIFFFNVPFLRVTDLKVPEKA